jgi:hypothetical protein
MCEQSFKWKIFLFNLDSFKLWTVRGGKRETAEDELEEKY